MACHLTAPSHYMNQCWFITNGVLSLKTGVQIHRCQFIKLISCFNLLFSFYEFIDIEWLIWLIKYVMANYFVETVHLHMIFALKLSNIFCTFIISIQWTILSVTPSWLLNFDFIFIYSSVAILSYLCDTRGVGSHWYPGNPRLRARVDEYILWHQFNTRRNAAMVFITQVLFYFLHVSFFKSLLLFVFALVHALCRIISLPHAIMQRIPFMVVS